MEDKIISLKKTARIAGMLYLALIITSLYAHMYVPSQLLVRGDAAATTKNIISHEFLFRTCIVVNLIEVIVFLFLALALYRLFQQVSNYWSRVMVALIVIQIPIVFVLAAFKITALMIIKGQVFTTFSPTQISELTMVFLNLNMYGMMAMELLSGLWLFPFGILVYNSRFIPRVLGLILIVAGIGYTIASFTYILLPAYHNQTQMIAYVLGIGEIFMMLWLLIKGAKEHIIVDVESEIKSIARPATITTKFFIE